jgi:hypothetical protein
MRQRKHNARRIFAWSIIVFGSYGFEMTGLSVQIVSLNRTWFIRVIRGKRAAERSLIRKTTPESLEELHSKKEPVAVSATPEDRPLNR